MKKNMGIKAAITASAIAVTLSPKFARAQNDLSVFDQQKMQELGLNPVEMDFYKKYVELVSQYPELQGQFGLARLHDHFALAHDEVLHETTDHLTQISTTVAVKKNQLPVGAVPSIISDGNGSLENSKVVTWCCD